MLKRVIVNSKQIPVPVPVHTLGEALNWIESTLVPPGHTITRVLLDDLPWEGGLPGQGASGGQTSGGANGLGRELSEKVKLEVQIDSPVDLIIQTLDAVHNLAGALLSGLKVLAVNCWQGRGALRPQEIDATHADLELVLDLLEHLKGLFDATHVDVAAIQGIAVLLRKATLGLGMAKANSDWRACARIFLNRLEPLLRDLSTESDSLKSRIAAQVTTGDVAPTGSV